MGLKLFIRYGVGLPLSPHGCGLVATGVRSGGLGGQPPPIDDWKRNENLSFWNDPLFSYRLAYTAIMFFCVIQLAYAYSRNFRSDACNNTVGQTFLKRYA